MVEGMGHRDQIPAIDLPMRPFHLASYHLRRLIVLAQLAKTHSMASQWSGDRSDKSSMEEEWASGFDSTVCLHPSGS